ncbi:ATP-binding protein [Bacteriovoracales bacterium]|nr:ATP-binding protein [Bacteriovoracales bacterium]
MVKAFLIFIFYLFSLTSSSAGPRPVVLGNENDFKEVGTKIQFLKDPSGKLTIDDINSPTWASKFETSTKSVPRFGFTKDTVWLRIKIINNTPDKKWIFNIGLPTLDHITFFKENKNKWIKTFGGDALPSKKWEMRYKEFIFTLSKKRESTYFFKVKNRGGMNIPITIMSEKYFKNSKQNFDMFYGGYFAILTIMFFYNLIIGLNLRSRTYMFFVGYLFFWAIMSSGLTGYGRYVFTDWIPLSNKAMIFSIGTSLIFFNLFAKDFLDLKNSAPKWGKFSHHVTLIGTALTFVALFLNLREAFLFIAAIGSLFAGTILTTSIYFFRSMKQARIAVYSFSIMLIGAFLKVGTSIGVLPSTFLIEQSVLIGSVIQLVFLSLGLADNFKMIQEESLKNAEMRLKAENETRLMRERYAEELEEEVRKQTKQAVNARIRAEVSEREVASLINNMRQSVFCIDETHIISPPVSHFSDKIFGESIEKKIIYETLYRSMDRKGEAFSKVYTALGIIFNADDLQWEMVKDLFPSRVILKDDDETEQKTLKIRYTPLWTEDGLLEKLMFVIEDITELEALEKQMKDQQEEISKKGQILQELAANKREELQNFFDGVNNISNESINIWKEIRTAHYDNNFLSDKMEIFLRNLHTIKGNARIYGFSVISQKAHEVETRVISFKEDSFEERETSDFDDYMADLYTLRGQINEYFFLAKDIFGVESEDDSKFKNEIHELMKDFEYWLGQTYFNSKATNSLFTGALSFLINIIHLDEDIRLQIFSSLKRILHSLKGVSRSINEKTLSENIHIFEGTIYELNMGQTFSREQIDDVFQSPIDIIRNASRKLYVSSSLFKPFNHTSDVWLDFYVGFFKLVNLFKNSDADKKQETIQTLYSLNYKSMGHHFLYIPCVLRSIYDLFTREDVLNKEKIRSAFQKIWSHFKFLIQIDIEKTIPGNLRGSLKKTLSQYDTHEDWEKGLKEVVKVTGLSQDPLLIKIFKRLIDQNITINDFIKTINFLENEGQGNIKITLDSLISSTDVSGLLNDVFSSLKNNFSSESVENILKINKVESETLEHLISIVNDSRTGWFPYLESIDIMRFLRDFIKVEDEDKNIRPEMFEVLVDNFYSLREQIIEEVNSQDGFSVNLIEQHFDALKQVPIKYSLKNLRMMVLEMGKGLGKKIKFSLKGEQGSLSKDHLALLKDGIVHLVRNSVDHGIEVPEERKSLNKEDFGVIDIKCFLDNDNKLNVEIKDDGKGINQDLIVEKALSKNFVTQDEVDKMSEVEKLNIIFLPNFSTKENVTEISGRGVGMDVVKKNIEKIGATIDLETSVGDGTTFTIKLK